MKKIIMFMLITILLFSLSSGVLAATLPGYEDAVIGESVATYTVKFLYPDGSGGSGTYSIPKDPSYTVDESIKRVLEGTWKGNETWIYAITHVNGVAIEKTKWASYGGPIKHVGTPTTITPTKPSQVFVFVEGQKVTFPDQQPYIKDDRTLVPLRAVFEHYKVQAEVQWVKATQTVIAKDRTGRTLIFRIGDKNFDIVDKDGLIQTVTNDVAPEITNSRTMLPLRALAEALNFQVDWLATTWTVDIKEKPDYDRKLMAKTSWDIYIKEFNDKAAKETAAGGGVNQ